MDQHDPDYTNADKWELACERGEIQRVSTCIPMADATDKEVKKFMISRSIATYSGSCPCPYNTDRAGRRCGKRSAYSKPGGASPFCYTSDITSRQVQQTRRQYQ